MNNEQPHINPWAEKLQQAPMPDANASWKGMEHLLDQHMPVEEEKKKRRFLVLFLVLCVILGAGLFMTGQFGHVQKRAGYSHQPVDKHTTTTSITGTANTRQEEERQPSTQTPGTTTIVVSDGVPAASLDTIVAPRKSVEKDVIQNEGYNKEQKANPVITTKVSSLITDKRAEREVAVVNDKRADHTNGGNAPVSTKAPFVKKDNSNKPAFYSTKKATWAVKKKRATSATSHNKKEVIPEDAQLLNATSTNGIKSNAKSGVTGTMQQGDTAGSRPQIQALLPYRDWNSPLAQMIFRDGLDQLHSRIVIDSLLDALKQQRDEGVNKKGWTFGIGLNHFFQSNFMDGAAATERAKAFNSDGISRSLGDYIPIPQVRYYFSNKLMAQGELQFNAPQYSQRVLLDQSSYQQGNSLILDTVYVKKLSYFNIPLGVYYSPVKNIYIGGGVQFSRLTNALALYNQTQVSFNGQPGDTLKVKVAKVQSIKDNDTLYKRIRTNEVRLFGDINYQIKRFTLGVRYNYALNDFVKVPVTNNNALTQARNHSLQVYLLYRILDKRRTIKPASK